jgi:WD40-like Beta Propeller Repeat
MILMGALAGFACAAAFAALLGTGAPSAGAVAACSNEAIRAQQHATQVGDCRAFERVSSAEKGGGDIIGEGLSTVAAADGNGAIFESRLLFGDAVASGNIGRTTYLARRGPDGRWSSHGITVEPRPDAIQVLTSGTKTEVFSDDLSRALVWAYDLPGAGDDTPDLNNLYREDTASRALETISKPQVEPIGFEDFFNRTLWGASDDLRHVGIVAKSKLLPEAAGESVPNAYKWDDGVLSLAGVLPDGTVPAAGSTIEPTDTRETVSDDGSRLAFFSSGQLYLHTDGKPSVWVSQPEGSDENPPANVHFEGMTPDGRNVFFVSDSPLLDADEASGPDMYRYTESANPATDSNLTLITKDGGAVNEPIVFGAALVGMSDDGRRVYVHDIGGHVDLWEEGSGIRAFDSVARGSDSPKQITLTATPGLARVSADGNWVAYIVNDQMRLYNREDDSVTCVSCPSSASFIPTLTDSGRLDYVGFRPRFLSDDGKVFFTSTGTLLPEDTNGVADVYEYDGQEGELRLVTSGRGKEPMEFVDASVSGDDVFFVTRQQLAAADGDEYVDLYDARVGGGIEEPEAPAALPCAGEACQGIASASVTAAAIRSGAAARGNLRQRRVRCAKNKRKVNRKGKVRCVKRAGERHHGRSAGKVRGGRR